MKLNRLFLPLNKSESFHEEIDFSKQEFDQNHVKRITACQVDVVAQEFGDILQCKISGVASLIASCSYTLEDVPLNAKFNETFYFSSEDNGSEDCYYEPHNEIDLDPYILALILAEVPHNIVKDGASLPESGEGYRVIKEDDYLNEKKNKKNAAFAILDTIEFDEN